jgi:glycosyltransferase involved in cell wall biosynthesis
MRVFVNAASAKMGGNVTYLQNVLRWLPRVAAADDTFWVCLPDMTRASLRDIDAPNLHVRAFPYQHTGGLARVFYDQVQLPFVLRRLDIDVLFSSTGFGTLYAPCPEVLLVRNPVYFSQAFREKYQALGRSLMENRLRRWMSILSMRRADRVLFPTAAMGDLVASHIRLPPDQQGVLSYGYDPQNFGKYAADPDFLPDLMQWKRDGHRILLNVSTYAVHKNLETLVEALPQLASSGEPVKLVVTTSRDATSDKAEYDALLRRVDELGVGDLFEEVGYVAPPHLHALYEAADVYVFPSFIESFGHTLVEAMGHNLPIVAADTPVNREVCEDGARYFSTFDAADCAAQILHLIEDDTARSEARQAARERSTDYSWKRYVEDLMQTFRAVAGAKREVAPVS